MMRNNGNAEGILQQMASSNPEQMKVVLQNAKKMGCPDEILSKIQNLLNKK